jgi:hypothetical protein
VRVELVEDRAVSRVVGQADAEVVDLPEGRRREQIAAVRVGLAEDRAEVPVRDRELPLERVIERLVAHAGPARRAGAPRSRGEDGEKILASAAETLDLGRPWRCCS